MSLRAAPTPTLSRRPLQGDALYVRDVCSDEAKRFAERLSPTKLLKAACIFELFGLPDLAAELILRFRSRSDSTSLLNLLVPSGMPYDEHIRRFREADPSFFPPRPTLGFARSFVRDAAHRLRARLMGK